MNTDRFNSNTFSSEKLMAFQNATIESVLSDKLNKNTFSSKKLKAFQNATMQSVLSEVNHSVVNQKTNHPNQFKDNKTIKSITLEPNNKVVKVAEQLK